MINILLIDDDPSMEQIFSSVLNKKEYKLICASTGMSGLNQVKEQKPDLIFLDQILPDIPGNNVLNLLKQDPETASIPVVMFSAFFDSKIKQEALKNGAIAYILKYDFDIKKLDQKIKQLLSVK